MKRQIYGSLLGLSLLTCMGVKVSAQDLPILNDGTVTSADTLSKLPKFAVVSVKEHRDDPNSMGMQVTPDGFIGRNLKLRDLICMAYGVRRDQIVDGPSWMSSTGYDIDAKVAEQDVERLKALPPTERRLMLQSVLNDRFSLKYHTVNKVMKIFELVQAGGAVTLKASSPELEREIATASPDNPGSGTNLTLGPNELLGVGLTTGMLASQLSSVVQRPVVDKTALKGHFDISLHWTPDSVQADNGRTANNEESESIFSAVRDQLGLKLVSSSGPSPVFVVDSVRPPSPN